MMIKYDADINNEAVLQQLHILINQIYKLLPNREEGNEWQKPLETITEELAGMDRILIKNHDILFPLLCKLEGLQTLVDDKDFYLYRRIIFECISLCSSLKEAIKCQD